MHNEDGKVVQMGLERSKLLWQHLREMAYINAAGKVQDHLRTALRENTLQLPEAFKPQAPEIAETLRKLAGKLDIKNADERITIKTREAILNGEEFKALWDRIKHKTTYRVEFDNEKLITDCARALRDCPSVTKTRLRFRTVDLAIGRGGVVAGQERTTAPVTLEEKDLELPDILTELQDKTHLTRRSLLRILKESLKLQEFLKNPQQFIEYAIEWINRTKRMALVDGIRYQRLGDNDYYAQELFQQEELTGYLKTGVILNLGDFFHSDNDSNRTPKSGNILDVDGRYAKILRVGVDLIIHCVQLGLQKHEEILLRCLPGNHDPYACLALTVALAAFFHNNPRVKVDDDASAFFKYKFGKVLVTACHGDLIKHGDMPGFVAATWPQDWGATEFRYCYLGHVHHRSIGGGERAGMQWETFQVLAPKDVWHKNSGYVSGRSMSAITHHKNHGEVMRHTVSVSGG
jgi:hypothetical protein